MPIKKLIIKKKPSKKKETFIPKQYTVFYNIGTHPEFFITHGSDYKLGTLDIKSPQTSETSSFPVIFVHDNIAGTLDIIPMATVGNIRHNWLDKNKPLAKNEEE